MGLLSENERGVTKTSSSVLKDDLLIYDLQVFHFSFGLQIKQKNLFLIGLTNKLFDNGLL